MAVRYSRLPTTDPSDDAVIDFGPAFNFTSATAGFTDGPVQSGRYKSAFTFTKSNFEEPSDIRYTRIKEPLFSRVCRVLMTVFAMILIVGTFPVTIWFCFKMVSAHERALVFRLGRLAAKKGPGMVFVIPLLDTFRKVDMRLKAFNVPPQQVITMDRGVIEVGADVYYKIVNAEKSVLCVQEINQSIRILVQSALKNALVQKAVQDVVENKLIIAATIQDSCNQTSSKWGIEITKVEIPQIKIITAPEAQNGLSNLPGGLPQTFQQLTAALMQASAGAVGPVQTPPQPQPTQPESVTLIPVDGAASSIDGAPSPREAMKIAQSLLSDSLIRNIGSVYLFQLNGDGGGVFYLDLKNGSGSAGEGLPPFGEPDVTLTLSVGEMQSMFVGNTKPLQSYMNGRLKVSGDLSAALRLEEFIKKVVHKIKSENGE